jgi:hypothetical protein
MRILSPFFKWLCPCAAALALPFHCVGAGKPDNVVLQYHFLGATQLAESSNAVSATKVFALPAATNFENLVLNRLATNLAQSLHIQTSAQTIPLLRPLLDDMLRAESFISMGGSSGNPINYVLAVHLDAQRAQAWQQNLKSATHRPGEELRADKFTGWQWNKGSGDSLWMVPAQNWLLVGRGGDLASVRSDYLQQIQKTGRPGPAFDTNCFVADVDWPRLANWFPLPSCPLKLGRTQIAIRVEKGHFYMNSRVTYPEAIQWKPHPMIIPTNLVHKPLLSFATGQNVEPFLKPDDTLSRLCTNPLSDQFYFWSVGELAFQSYVAWPVKDARSTMQTLSSQAIAELNPKLQQLDGTKLIWLPKGLQIVWMGLQMATPNVRPAPATNGQFIVASLFAPTPGQGPAPKALWEHLEGRTNLVFYDWDFTGPRVRHLLTVTETLPILQMLGMGPGGPSVAGASSAKPGATSLDPGAASRLGLAKRWLIDLSLILPNTITEVTKTGPNELTIVRDSPFVFNSLELILLSHWLSDTPTGPLDTSLLPVAKMEMGMPSH